MHTIGKVARMAGVSADTLRFYEAEGLLAPVTKTTAGYRLYDNDAVRRLHFIKHAQACGFTLSDVKELLTLQNKDNTCCEDVRTLVIEKKLQIERKLKALQAMSRALDGLIKSCEGGLSPTNDCPILGALDDSLGEASP